MKPSQKFVLTAVAVHNDGQREILYAIFTSKTYKDVGEWVRTFKQQWRDEGLVLDEEIAPLLIRVNE